MERSPVYLIMVGESNVDSSDNHNKYYEMIPNGDNTFTAKYGRIGAGEQRKIYPMSKWDSTYKSKIKKGYQDITNLKQDIIEDSKVEDTPVQDKFSVIKNISVRDILKKLWDFANKTVQSSYKVSSEQVTQAMIDAAQKIIDEISNNYTTWTVEEFNSALKRLFITIPRKMKTVKSYLLDTKGTKEDREKIIQREQDTLDAMMGMVYVPKSNKSDKNNNEDNNKNDTVNSISVLDEMGIEMEDCDEEDIKKIKKAMGDSADKFYKAWRVKNIQTEKEYQEFTKKNKIGNVNLLCHGSRNQNWFNILKSGLLIRPAGVITTGSMFGSKCLYFGNPNKYHGGVQKSIGYTSLGGYWTRDYQNCGFLAFFDVAIGDSLDVYNFDSKYYNFDLKKLQEEKPNAWSLWAHGNTSMLRNDEIVVYTTKQMTIRYLVEIR